MDSTLPDSAAPASQTSSTPDPLEAFAQNLLYDKGAAALDPDLVEGMKEDIMQRLSLLSTQVVLEALTDQETAEFEQLVDNKATVEQLQQYANEKIPDLAQRMTEALTRFRLAYLGADA